MARKGSNFTIFFLVLMVIMLVGLLLLGESEPGDAGREVPVERNTAPPP